MISGEARHSILRSTDERFSCRAASRSLASIIRSDSASILKASDRGIGSSMSAVTATVFGKIPSIALGVYMRILTIGSFEGIDCERGGAWRCAHFLLL